MNELFIATGNRGKFSELQHLLQNSVRKLYSMDDYPDLPPVLEDGATFEENAVKKARSAASLTGKPSVADDSGLLVAVLGNRPGVHSARYAGESATDAGNNEKLLRELAGIPFQRRTAVFRSVIALCQPGGECLTFDGELKGLILEEPRGNGGFGYDPLFFIPELGQTIAELPLDVKNAVSHRGMAFLKLKHYLQGC